MQRIQSTEKQENNNKTNKKKIKGRERTFLTKKKKKQQRVCRGSAADMETFSPRSQKADRIATYSATLSDLLPTWFQLDCKGNPSSNGKAAFKAKSATRCWRCPHLRATGKCRPSIKHKTKMHYHLESIMGEQPWKKRKLSDKDWVIHLWHGPILSASLDAKTNCVIKR